MLHEEWDIFTPVPQRRYLNRHHIEPIKQVITKGALKGHQPEVLTSGIRKADKVFGLIDYFSGRLFSKAHTGRFNSESYAAFLLDVLAQTTQPICVIQDGARYHTSKAMEEFFAAHVTRLTKVQLPAYSPDFNPGRKSYQTDQ